MTLFVVTLLIAVATTSMLAVFDHFYGHSHAPVIWLFAPNWLVIPNFPGVWVALLVQSVVGWSGWLSSDLSSLVLCALGDWLGYFGVVKLALF